MSNQFSEMSDSMTWNILVSAAKRAMEEKGFNLERIPGRGRSNVWEIEQNGNSQRASIRTTKNRWIAFPPLERGTKWKTLDDVDVVFVAAVDDRDDPRNIEVYQFDAGEVRKRFNEAHAARKQAGQTLKDNFGMWVNLDEDNRGLPASVGAGIANEHGPVATYSLSEFIADDATETEPNSDDSEASLEEVEPVPQTHTIAEVMDWARQRIAQLSGVRTDAVKINCKIEY